MRTSLLAIVAILAATVAHGAGGTFTRVGDMTLGRYAHTATVLNDGKVLLTGGSVPFPHPFAVTRSAELYDPATRRFVATGSMLEARLYHSAALLPNGQVLIVGRDPAAGAEIYDPASGTFRRAASLRSPKFVRTATTLANGKVLVATSDHAELYDFVTDTFTMAGPYAVQAYHPTATLLADGRVFFVGDDPAQLYDPSRDAFSVSGSTHDVGIYGLEQHTATLLEDGRVLIAGGSNDEFPAGRVDIAELFDPATGAIGEASRLLWGRDVHAAVRLLDGRVLLVGGEGAVLCDDDECPRYGGPLATAEIYDPATRAFSPAGTMTIPRSLLQATLLRDGDVLITGGVDDSGAARAEIYHPSTTDRVAGLFSGIWWNAREPGWGIHFTQRRDTVVAVWYAYDAAGNPAWFIAPDCKLRGVDTALIRCKARLLRTSGPDFFGEPGDLSAAAVGSLEVMFGDADNAILSYSVGGEGRIVPIVREPLTSRTATAPLDYTDFWWNPREPGWGLTVAQQSDVLFLAWLIHDGAHRPVWSAGACRLSGSTCTAELYETRGPALGPSFDPARVSSRSIGTLTVEFSGANAATMTYVVGDSRVTEAIARLLF